MRLPFLVVLLLAACADGSDDGAAAPDDAPGQAAQRASATTSFRPDAEACLAQTIYHEARGESVAGMRAVGAVVLNRRASVGYPDTVCGVVRQADDLGRCQFSWFCDGRTDVMKDGEALARAQAAARALMNGAPDPTGGATSFHATRIRPAWADEMEETARIGAHVFYANEAGEEG